MKALKTSNCDIKLQFQSINYDHCFKSLRQHTVIIIKFINRGENNWPAVITINSKQDARMHFVSMANPWYLDLGAYPKQVPMPRH